MRIPLADVANSRLEVRALERPASNRVPGFEPTLTRSGLRRLLPGSHLRVQCRVEWAGPYGPPPAPPNTPPLEKKPRVGQPRGFPP